MSSEYDRLAWLSITKQMKELREQRDQLLAACELAFAACRTNLTYASFKDEHCLRKAHDACKAAIKKAKGE